MNRTFLIFLRTRLHHQGLTASFQRHGQVAASYDCNPCCCPPSYDGAADYTSPSSPTIQAGATQSLAFYAYYQDCNFGSSYADETAAATWTSGDTSIVTVNASGNATGAGVGSATVQASYSDYAYVAGCSCIAQSVQHTSTASVTVEGCGDDRDHIIPQYAQYPTIPEFVPGCPDFTDDASTANLSFAELDVNQSYAWAILRSVFLNGLQSTRNSYGSPMTVNSGYREPAYNYSIGGAQSSQHVFGTAADIASDSTTWGTLAHDANQDGACVEPYNYTGQNKYDHVHMDWRGACPAGWTGF